MKLYCADYLLPMTSNAEGSLDVIRGGAIAVNGNAIADAGAAADVKARHAGASITDLGNSVLMPGLVNGHAHCPMSFLRGYADDRALMDWLNNAIFPAEAKLTGEITYAAAMVSCAEMMRTGTTAFYDMYMLMDGVADAVEETGMRALLGHSVSSFTFTDDFFGILADRAAEWPKRYSSRVRMAITPHAPYTTKPGLLRRCADFACEHGWPLGIHLCETLDEEGFCLKEYGKRPVDHADSLGLLRNGTTLFHMIHVNRDEIARVAESGCAVVHNPASNMKLASGFAPVDAMLKAGVNVGIGTDGPASNNAQNMFREMYLAALIGKGSTSDPTALPAASALRMATLGGAHALQWPGLGQLAAGNPADFIALSLDEPNMVPVHDIASSLAYSASGMETRLTVVDGREIYRDGEFADFDYEAAVARLRGIASKI